MSLPDDPCIFHEAEEFAFSCRLEIGDGTLQHVPGIVELVVVAQVGPALVNLAIDIRAVQIAIRQRDIIDLAFCLFVWPVGQCIGRCFDPNNVVF
jgi:hypothetical protein